MNQQKKERSMNKDFFIEKWNKNKKLLEKNHIYKDSDEQLGHLKDRFPCKAISRAHVGFLLAFGGHHVAMLVGHLTVHRRDFYAEKGDEQQQTIAQ